MQTSPSIRQETPRKDSPLANFVSDFFGWQVQDGFFYDPKDFPDPFLQVVVVVVVVARVG